jgi:hypothetical protein
MSPLVVEPSYRRAPIALPEQVALEEGGAGRLALALLSSRLSDCRSVDARATVRVLCSPRRMKG